MFIFSLQAHKPEYSDISRPAKQVHVLPRSNDVSATRLPVSSRASPLVPHDLDSNLSHPRTAFPTDKKDTRVGTCPRAIRLTMLPVGTLLTCAAGNQPSLSTPFHGCPACAASRRFLPSSSPFRISHIYMRKTSLCFVTPALSAVQRDLSNPHIGTAVLIYQVGRQKNTNGKTVRYARAEPVVRRCYTGLSVLAVRRETAA